MVPGLRAETYCFEEPGLFLEVEHAANADYTEFHHLRKVQERIIPGEIIRSFSGRYLFKFSLDEMKWINADDPALKPTTDAKVSADNLAQSQGAAQTRLMNTVPPVYPPEAKSNRISGSVLL